MHISQEEMAHHQIPLEYRDYCAHLLPELNKCRKASWYMPWACTKERTAWQKCQYDDYQRRMRLLDKRQRQQEIDRLAALQNEEKESL